MRSTKVLAFIRDKKWFLLAFGVLLLISIPLFSFLRQYYTEPKGYTIELSPAVLADPEAWEAYVIEDGEKRLLTFENGLYSGIAYQGQTFYMDRVMREAWQPTSDPYLEITAIGEYITVFLDGEMIFTEYPQGGNRIGEIEFPLHDDLDWMEQHTVNVSLPRDYLGKTLSIVQSEPAAPYAEGYVYACFVKLTTASSYIGFAVASAVRDFTPLVFFLVLAGLLLAIFLARLYYRSVDWSLLLLAAAALLWALSKLTSPLYSFWPQVLPDALTDVLLSVFPLPILAYLCIKLKTYRKWGIMLGLLLAVFIMIQPWDGYRTLYFSNVDLFSILDFLVSLLVYTGFLYLLLLEAQHRNPQGKRRVKMLGGFLLLVVAACVGFAAWNEDFRQWLQTYLIGTQYRIEGVFWLMVLISAIILSVRDFVLEFVKKNTQIHTLRAREEMAAESYQSLEQYNRQVSMLRHDMRNHLTVLHSLLSVGDAGKANQYLDEMIAQSDEVPTIVHTPNQLVNIVLNSKLAGANEDGVQVMLALDVPETLPIKDNDLAGFLVNLLDNAANALSRMPKEGERVLILDMHVSGNYLYISCKNSMGPVPNEKNAAKAPAGTGYGLSIMQGIVDRYQGLWQMEKQDGFFVVEAALSLQEKRA